MRRDRTRAPPVTVDAVNRREGARRTHRDVAASLERYDMSRHRPQPCERSSRHEPCVGRVRVAQDGDHARDARGRSPSTSSSRLPAGSGDRADGRQPGDVPARAREARDQPDTGPGYEQQPARDDRNAISWPAWQRQQTACGREGHDRCSTASATSSAANALAARSVRPSARSPLVHVRFCAFDAAELAQPLAKAPARAGRRPWRARRCGVACCAGTAHGSSRCPQRALGRRARPARARCRPGAAVDSLDQPRRRAAAATAGSSMPRAFGGLQVDDQVEPGRLLDRADGPGLAPFRILSTYRAV